MVRFLDFLEIFAKFIEVKFVKRRGPMAVAEGVAWVGDQKAAEAEIKCMVIMD